MADRIEKITGIYERKLLRQFLLSDHQINGLYSGYTVKVADILAQYRTKKNGIVIRDPDLDKQLAGVTDIFKKQLKKQIEENQLWAFDAANNKTDDILKPYIENIPSSIIAKKGLFERNEEAFREFQKRKYEGMDLSGRVWKLSDDTVMPLIEDYIDNGLVTGRPATNIAQDLKQLLEKPNNQFRRVRDPKTGKLKLSTRAREYSPGQGVYRSSIQNAKRLARTEINMAYRTADQERWKMHDFILGYEICLRDNHPVPDICDAAAGKYPKSFRFVGWHPACRCYMVPILAEKSDFIDSLVDGKKLSGHIEDVPDGFKEWVAANKEKISGWKSQPFWVRDNFKDKRIENGIAA